MQLPTPLAHSPVEPTSSVRPRPIARRRKARVAWDAYRNFAARGGGKPAADAGLAFGFAAAGHDAAANAIEAQNTARANLAASPEQRALARSIVVRGGSSTDADVDAITNALLGMPPARLTRIRDDGVRIASSRGSITDHAVDLRGVAPRGWPPGSTFDTVPGVYRPEKKDVIISTIEGPNGTRVVSNAHGSYDMVLHELGHAVDGAVVENASTDARFAATRERDLAALPEYMRQPGEAGASETYAEAFARYYGANPRCVINGPPSTIISLVPFRSELRDRSRRQPSPRGVHENDSRARTLLCVMCILQGTRNHASAERERDYRFHAQAHHGNAAHEEGRNSSAQEHR